MDGRHSATLSLQHTFLDTRRRHFHADAGFRSSAKKSDNSKTLHVFSREKVSLYCLFFRKLHHDANRRQCWSSVGCSYIQKHKSVCLHSITSQLTRTASSRVLSVPLRTGAQSHACCASWSSMERRARRASLTPEDRACSWIYLTHLWALGSSPAPRVGGGHVHLSFSPSSPLHGRRRSADSTLEKFHMQLPLNVV